MRPSSLLFCSALLVFGASAGAQTIPQRDAQAVNLLGQALTALGGTANIAAIKDSTVSGTIQMMPSGGSAGAVRTFTWTVAGNEFREQEGSGADARLFVSGHGKPASERGGKVGRINYHVARANLPFYLPELVLYTELSGQKYTLTFVGNSTLEGKAAIHVHISDDSDSVGKLVTPQEWYFDAASSLPLRVEFRLPSNENAADYSTAAFDFSDYQAAGGVLVPLRLTYFQDGKAVGVVSVSTARLNTGVLSSDFDAPEGGGE